jgi:hypothetical protein
MAKKVIDHLEKIYKEELDSHDIIKNINNDNNMPIKLDNYFFKKKKSSKNIKHLQANAGFRNSLVFKKKNNRNSIGIYPFKPKQSNENIFIYSNGEKEEEKIDDLKIIKKNNVGIKVCKTLKNCGDNIKNAKLLLFDKSNNKQSMRPMKNFSNKNFLTTKKRGNFLPTTRRHRKLKEKELSENN